MAQLPRPLIVMHPNSAFQERVRRVGGKGFRCTFLPDWDALRGAVSEAPPSALLIVDPYSTGSPDGPQLAPELRALLREFPSATVVAARGRGPGRPHAGRT